MPSREDLLALPYSGAAKRGMTAGDYKSLWSSTGDSVEWWKGYQVDDGAVRDGDGNLPDSNGYLYIKQVLADDVRVFIHNDDNDITTERITAEYLELSHGRTSVDYLPQEIALGLGDRLLVTSRTVIGRVVVIPNGQASVALPHGYVAAIQAVLSSDGVLDSSLYGITADETRSGITWTGEVPGGRVFVEYLYNPVLIFLKHWNRIMDHSNLQGPSGIDGSRLPQRVTMIQDRI